MYTADDYEEPPFQYVPDVPILNMGSARGGSNDIQSPLASSMLLLAEAIETGISSQFELLTRKKPEMTCDAAKLPENNSKNRYRDISPCTSHKLQNNGSYFLGMLRNKNDSLQLLFLNMILYR